MTQPMPSASGSFPAASNMDEHEFASTPAIHAINEYLELAGGILELIGTIYHVFDATVAGALSSQLQSAIGEKYAPKVVAGARRHKEANHEVLHTLAVIASWAALEALITDLCGAMLQMEPALVETGPFQKVTLPAHIVLIDRPAQLEYIAEIAFAGGVAETDDGKGKFERLLRMVGLGGTVPADLAKALVWANAVRNIFVHNGSHVDKRFLERCPDSGYSLDDKVALAHVGCADILLGLETYMFVVMNRLRLKYGLRPMQCSQSKANKFRDSFNEMFPGAIGPEQLL
jgi:hypothetical protein